MKIGEFFAELGVEGGTEMKSTLTDLISSFGAMEIATVGEIGALVELGLKFFKVSQDAFAAAVAFQMFSNQTGLSWQELQKWQIVAQQANVSAESVSSSVMGLQRAMAQIRLGGGNIAPFQILGVGINQDAFAVLRQLREIYQSGRVDKTMMSQIFLPQLGMSSDMTNVLSLNNKQFSDFEKTIRGIGTTQETSFLKGKLALTQLGLVLKQVGIGITDFFGPVFVRGVQVVQLLSDVFVQLLGTANEFPKTMIAVGVAIAAAMGFLSPMVALVAALLLILDDLATWARGGKSLFGLVFEDIRKNIKEIKADLADAFSLPGAANPGLGIMGGAAKSAWQAALLGPLTIPFAGASAATAASVQHIHNLTVNVKSVDEARQVAADWDKQISDAEIQTNNQGR